MITDRHPSIWTLDASKIKSYMECPRSFFFRYVLGWEPDTYRSKYHLVFGRALHIALEHLLLHGMDDKSIMEAYDKFLEDYRSEPEFTPETDDMREPKTPSRALQALVGYAERYKHEDAELDVLYTETSGQVLVAEDIPILFRVDAIVRDDHGIFVLEHKTASRLSQGWIDQWALSVQVGLYIHLLMSLFNPDEVWGAKINGIFLYKSKKPDFVRVPIMKNETMLENWRLNMLKWVQSIMDDLMSVDKDTGRYMTTFRMNTQSCSNYYGCPYRDLCMSWDNPVLRSDEPPAGFRVRWWDPRDLDEGAQAHLEGAPIKDVNQTGQLDLFDWAKKREEKK